MEGHGQERGLVAPVLEQRPPGPRVRRGVEMGRVVGAQAGEEREIVRAHEDVHGVDLQESQTIERADELPRRGPRLVPSAVEALSRERHPPCLDG